MTDAPTRSAALYATPATGGLVVGDLRRVAAAATGGLVVGFVVNGWGSRLAMMLLARLNPQVTGRLSDDGFVMGQFDLGDTLNLVFVGTALGVAGGLLFLVLRVLRFGPTWFQTTSMTVGPAVVVGALLVHTDGIDFHVLEPVWLAIALFVALPGLFAYAMTRLGDQWLRDESIFLTGRRAWILGLAPLVLLGPALAPVVLVFAARVLHHRAEWIRRLTTARVVPIIARGALTAVFLLALTDLTRDTLTLL